MAKIAAQQNMLDKIMSHKRKEVAENEELYPRKLLEKSIYFESEPVSFKSYIGRKDLSGVIAEFKRRSPSKGNINEHAEVEPISIGYMQAGAAALSILTDQKFFGGTTRDLSDARKFNYCPILRKDFICDEYQVIESKSIGADAILLIAAVLTPDEVKSLSTLAHALQLQVLLEVRSKEEIHDYLTENIDVVGVNNRNLKTFEVDLDISIELLKEIPDELVKISESGISDPLVAHTLQEAGFDGLLMGERFMKNNRPHLACMEFIKGLKELK